METFKKREQGEFSFKEGDHLAKIDGKLLPTKLPMEIWVEGHGRESDSSFAIRFS